jgi:allantoinase
LRVDADPTRLFPNVAIVDRPQVTWPGGAHLAVWVIPNIEHYHLDLFQPGRPVVRDYAQRDYGNRVGVWRLMEVMQRHGVRGTVALNAEVCQRWPRIIEAARALDWELMGHGVTNSTAVDGLDEDDERGVVTACRHAIEGVGATMYGWLGPGLKESWRTLDLLREAGGEYVADWCNDDLPYPLSNGLFAIPYTLELNDMPNFGHHNISAEDFRRRICDAFDVLYAEGRGKGRVMAIALHPFLTGAPTRIRCFDEALSYIASRDGVWFATGHEIIDSYRQQMRSVPRSLGGLL